MAVPFGFSVGDIIAGIGVIKTSIGAFSNTRGATESHKSLSDVLTRLCNALEGVREVETDAIHDAGQREAIAQAVSQCRKCIDAFVEKIAKYKVIQPGMQPKMWRSRFEKAAKKIQWALCEQADITKFKSDIQLQLDAISVLFVSLQIHRATREASQQDRYRQQTCSVLGQQSLSIETIKDDQIKTLSLFLQQLDLARNIELISQTNQTTILNQGATLSGLESQNGQLLAIANETKSIVQALKCMTDEQRLALQEVVYNSNHVLNTSLPIRSRDMEHKIPLAGSKDKKHEDEDKDDDGELQGGQRTIICYKCGESGHYANDPHCYKCGEFGHYANDSHCYKCGEYGHYANDPHCYRCDQWGHFANACRI